MARRGWLWALGVALGVALGCGGDDGGSDPADTCAAAQGCECAVDGDCAGGACVNGMCGAVEAPAMGADAGPSPGPDAGDASSGGGSDAGALDAGDSGAGDAGDVGDAGLVDAAVDAGADAAMDMPHRFDIRFDYRFDVHGFFDDPVRRAVLEAAADVWRDLLRDDFAEIPAGTPIAVYDLVDLDAPDPIEFTTEEPIDDLLIFAACSPDLDALDVAGRARRIALFPGAMGAEFQQMLMDRWRGADQEPWAVGITFGCARDFFFDPTPKTDNDVAGQGKLDFLNTAMHEMGHVLGFGSSNTYEALRSADDSQFLGPIATELYGGPVPLAPGGGHFQDDLMWEGDIVLMDPDSANGERTYPTALDLAVMEDIGYEIAR